MKLVFATNNRHKIKEISEMVHSHIELISLKDADITEEIPEDEPTLEGNALFKARYVYQKCGMNVFADDTGLEVNALDGAPGVHSARYAGNAKDSASNIDKLLAALRNKEDRSARFRTVIALILDGKEYIFDGTAEGTIIKKKKGSEGFGYDPVFVPDGYQQTYAEMSLETKNTISHRAKAFAKLTTFLSEHNNGQ